MLLNIFSGCFCLFNLFVPNRLIRISIIGSYMVDICPTPYSAAMGPRASRVRSPRDCAPGSAPVLKCVWMKLHCPFLLCKLWNHFSPVLFVKGVGPKQLTKRIGCFRVEF